MEISTFSILLASVLQFIVGALWYSPLMFGKMWMHIMEIGHLSKEELQKMQKEMTPYYVLQFVLTLFTTFSFANLLPYVPAFSAYHVAFWLWIGFIAPIQIASVIWGNTKKRFWFNQTCIMLGMQFVGIMLAAFVFSM